MPSLAIKHDTHNALVLATAPLLMIMPFVLKFTPIVGLVSVILGGLLMAIALAGASPNRPLPLAAQSEFEWALGLGLMTLGVAAGIAFSNLPETIFLVGFGAAHLALTASTRFSARSA